MLDALKKSADKETMLSSILSMEPTPRVERMRSAFFDLEPTVSIDRARIEARVMKETAGQPMITRRAKVFAAAAREMPIEIGPDELIVGGTSNRDRCANLFPGTWQSQSRTTNLPGLNDEDMRELDEELAPYWREQKRFVSWHYGHNINNMKRVMEEGFLVMREVGYVMTLQESKNLKMPFDITRKIY